MPDAGAPRLLSPRLLTPRQRWAAPGSGHDRVVSVSRIALPMAIGVLAAFLVMAPVYSGGDVSFMLDKNKVEVARERLKIQSATYRGEDQKGQPFTLLADSAVQRSSAEPVVQLRGLTARIALPDGPADVRAPAGRYDMDAQRLATVGPVRVTGAGGYRLDTQDATLDLKTRRMASGAAATGTVPQGIFAGDRMSADLVTRTVTLDGHARLRIVPHRAR